MKFLLYLLVFWSIIPPCFAARRQAKKFLLSIGIDEYTDKYWRNLQFAAKDATDIYNYFQNRFDGGWLLTTHNDVDRKVSKSEILNAINRLSVENTSEEDTVIVYISSHGTVGRVFDQNQQTNRIRKFLVTADTDAKNLEQTALEHEYLFTLFSQLKSRRKVIILDACYSGAGKSRLTQSILDQLASQKSDFFKEPDDPIQEGTIYLSASAWGEEAREDGSYANGIYTHFLLEGFNHDFNKDGAVSITEAHQYATDRVIHHTSGAQHPTAKIEVVGKDPIIVNGKVEKKGPPLLYAYEWFMRKFSIELDGEKLGNLSKGAVLLKPGRNQLVVKDEQNKIIIEKYFEFKNGEEYPLSAYLYYQPRIFISGGPTFSRIFDKELANKLFGNSFQGYQLSWQKHQALFHLALAGDLIFYPQKISTIQSKGLQIEQKSFILGGELRIMDELRLPSIKKDKIDSSILYGVGARFWHFEREVYDQSFLTPKQQVNLFALSTKLSLKFLFKPIQSNLNLSLSLSLFNNPTAIGQPQFLESDLSLGWGWHW